MTEIESENKGPITTDELRQQIAELRCVPRKRTIGDRLFPRRGVGWPEWPADWNGRTHVRIVTLLSWRDRIRCFFGGVVVTDVQTVSQNDPGTSRTSASLYASTRGREVPKP